MGSHQAGGRHAGQRRTALAVGVAVALAIAAGSGPVSASSRPQRAPAGFFGVVSEHPTDRDFSEMAASGVGTWRVTLPWSAIESSPGSYNWQVYDELIARAAQHGIQALVTIYSTPDWANGGCGLHCPPNSGAGRAAFATFVRAAVERYGPGGEFWTGAGGPPACGCSTPMPIRTWQIWNEPNSPKYYLPAPNPAEYAKLVGAAAGQIHAVDPGAEVVLGGMWGPPSATSVIPTVAYLRQLYAVPGVEASFDSIGVHPYSKKLQGVIDQVRRVHRLSRRVGDPEAGIWVTELGWASAGPSDNDLVKTPEGQARMLKRSFRALIKHRRGWRIRGVAWFKWSDNRPEEANCLWCSYAGLRTLTGEVKPAGRAFTLLASRGR